MCLWVCPIQGRWEETETSVTLEDTEEVLGVFLQSMGMVP